MKKSTLKIVLSLFLMISLGVNAQNKLADGIYAEFNTTKGKITCMLEYEKTPMTVANFVGLAEGNFKVFDSLSFTKPYYDGILFHRIIKGFMIQGGCPQGNGTGGPGYQFYDEFHADLTHSGPGILSMANSGISTNGSQFFITHAATPWLDGKHSVFGHVVQGLDILDSIASVKTGANDKPVNDVIMKSVKIIRVGSAAKKWDATKIFNDTYNAKKIEIEVQAAAELKKIEEYKTTFFNEVKKTYPNAIASPTGLVYVIDNAGEGSKPQFGQMLSVHYTGTLFKDGKKFDSSYDRNEPIEFPFTNGGMIPGFLEGLTLIGQGGKAKLFLPYFLAYGSQEYPGIIPAYSDLVFEIEMVSIDGGAAGHDHHEGDGHQH
jgi:peptidyl-prolyl cis-trans isomerase A (cyclophilin A)